jgi:6-pyruvoyltetrahydropterin/6-carboxytetrahydropterin synthase
MPITYLTRRERFSAAHRLFRTDLDDKKNYDLYGQCSHPNWHGHNYELFVTVKGVVDSESGYLLNLKTLSNIIRKEIIDNVDHKNLNIDVDFFKDIIPSTENLVVAIWNQLKKPVISLGAELYKIKLQETENNFVEYYGE